MEKEKTELEKLREKIKKLEEREKEYFKWLKKNHDSLNWEAMRQDWKDIIAELHDLRTSRDHIVMNNL